jgi:TonB-dependent receptor
MKAALLCGAAFFACASSPVLAQPNADVANNATAQSDASPQPSAPADAAAAAADDVIVVIGIRASQRASQDVKRNSSVIVDAITATEVGKFPDANIADSLQRITGVAIQRNNGEGQFITVRGFGPQYNNVLVNGRTMATGTNGREFDFGSLSSNLISRAEVYKSYQPQLQEGGIGATVNITTARPIEGLAGFHVTAHGGGVRDLLAKTTTPDVGGILTYRNDDSSFGIEASLNYTQRKSFEDSAQVGGWFAVAPNSNTVSIINGTPASRGLTPAAYSFLNAGGMKDLFLPQDYQFWRSSIDSRRLTGNATVQYRPADTLLLTFDALYSRYTLARPDRLYKSFFVQPYFSDIAFDQNGTVTHFTRPGRDFFAANPALGADPRSVPQQSDNVVNDGNTRIKTRQFGGNAKWEASERLSFEADLSNSRADYLMTQPASVIGNYLNGNLSFDIRPDQLLPSVTRTDTIVPSQLTNHFTWDIANKFKDDITEGRLQAEWKADSGILSVVQVGGLFSKRRKTSDYFQTFGANFCAYCGYSTPIDTTQIRSFTLKNWLPNSSGSNNIISNFYTFDVPKILAYQSLPATLATRTASEQAALSTADFLATGGFARVLQPGSGFDVTEQVVAGYVNTAWKGDFWSANAGVRITRTRTSSSGVIQPVLSISPNPNDSSLLQFTYGPATNTTIKNNYFNVLPAANLKIDATSTLVARFAVSKTLTRPTLSNLGPNNTYAGRVTEPISSGGNPLLNPFTSWNYDASIEWYATRDISLTADVFHKKFSSFLSNQTLIVPRQGNNLSGQPTTYNFNDTRPRNGNNGTVTGAEVAGQYSFPGDGFLSGFGLSANYTYVTSNQKVVTPGGCTQIEGLSKHSYNATAFYEKFGIQARGSYNRRSGYLVACRGLQGKPQNANAYGQFDASIAYDINNNFQVYLEGVNLNNAYSYQYSIYQNRFLNNVSFGRRLLIGARFKY